MNEIYNDDYNDDDDDEKLNEWNFLLLLENTRFIHKNSEENKMPTNVILSMEGKKWWNNLFFTK